MSGSGNLDGLGGDGAGPGGLSKSAPMIAGFCRGVVCVL